MYLYKKSLFARIILFYFNIGNIFVLQNVFKVRMTCYYCN